MFEPIGESSACWIYRIRNDKEETAVVDNIHCLMQTDLVVEPLFGALERDRVVVEQKLVQKVLVSGD